MNDDERELALEAFYSHPEGDRRVARTRRAICEATMKLLRTCDLDKVTVTAIARTADIDRKTFYLHYKSIEDVLDDIGSGYVKATVHLWYSEANALPAPLSVDDAAEVLSRVCVMLVQNVLVNADILEHMTPDKLLSKLEGPLTEAIIEQDVLGISSAMGPLLPYAVSYVCSGLLAVLRRWLSEGKEVPLEDLADMMSRLVATGIGGIVKEG